MSAPDIFLITSVINTGNNRWSYTATRSVYSTQERFDQTLHTIQSIRDLSDGSLIFLSECSDLSSEMTEILKSRVDFLQQNYTNDYCRNACINSEKKGYGELVKTKLALEFLKYNNIVFNRLFKISGRYFLNGEFKKSAFSSTDYVFRVFFPASSVHSTVLYSVPRRLLDHFQDVLTTCESIYKQRVAALEEILPPRCDPKSCISILGVSGHVAVTLGEFWSG
jgi:hypothetical protein